MIREKVDRRASSQSKWETIMTDVKEQINCRPRLALGLALTAAIAAFCTVVPFSYDQTVGYDLAYCCVASPQTALRQALEANLVASGYEESWVEYSEAQGLYSMALRNLPTRTAAEYYSAALAVMTEDPSGVKLEEVTRENAATLYAQAVEEYRLARREQQPPSPIKVRISFDEAININGHDIRDVIFSRSMTDDEIAEKFREIYVGDDEDLQDLIVKVTTDEVDNERLIVVGPEDRDVSSSALEEYLTLGIDVDKVFLKVNTESGKHVHDDSAAVEIVIPSREESVKGHGIVLKVYLPEEE
jgi:hypothetical protein